MHQEHSLDKTSLNALPTICNLHFLQVWLLQSSLYKVSFKYHVPLLEPNKYWIEKSLPFLFYFRNLLQKATSDNKKEEKLSMICFIFLCRQYQWSWVKFKEKNKGEAYIFLQKKFTCSTYNYCKNSITLEITYLYTLLIT